MASEAILTVAPQPVLPDFLTAHPEAEICAAVSSTVSGSWVRHLAPATDYSGAVPTEGVRMVNAFSAAGHHFLLQTGRGTASGLEWREETERQLRARGVQSYELSFGKHLIDAYIDDRAVNVYGAVTALRRGVS